MRPRQFTDEELYAVARRVFLEHGPGVSTAVIAAELGVSSPALFRRVGTKEELLLRAMTQGLPPPWIERVVAGPDERPVREQLLDVAHEVDAFFTRMMPAFSTLRAAGICPQDLLDHFDEPPPVRAIRALTGWFQRLHERGRVRAPNPEAVAIAFLGSMHARSMFRHILGDVAPTGGPDYLRDVVDMLLQGISIQEETKR